MKIEKAEDSAFISEAADELTPFGGPVKFKKFVHFLDGKVRWLC